MSFSPTEISELNLEGFELHAFIVELFLDQPDWFARLDPHSSPEERERHRQELREDLEAAREFVRKQFPQSLPLH